MDFLIHILVNAVLLFVVGRLIGGVEVRDGKAAIFGAVALWVANVSVRKLLVVLTFPITMITLGLFLVVINALMLMLAAAFVDGFEVEDFPSAIMGSIALTVMGMLVAMVF